MKNRPYLIPITAIALVLLSFTFVDDPLDTLLARLDKLRNGFPQEKVHLHLDKPYYSVGEDIWFKAYVVDAKENHLSGQSKVLYVDLLDDRDSVKQALLLPVINGTVSGNIHLSDQEVTAGNYHILAYTKWMANFGSEYYFKKDIAVVNALQGAVSGTLAYKTPADSYIIFKNADGTPFGNQPVSYTLLVSGKPVQEAKGQTDADGKLHINYIAKQGQNGPVVIATTLTTAGQRHITQNFVIRQLAAVADMQFFPEGGRLVAGIRSKIGFKALKPDGWGESISGYVVEEGSNEHLAEFASEHAGMGVFALLPVPGKAYAAVIKHADGSEKRYPLPKAEATGYVLSVNHVGDSLLVRVSASAGLADGREAALVAQCNGQVQFAAKIKMDRASNVSYIPAKKFRTGIIQFTLFTPDMLPVAERLVFIDHNDGLRAEIRTDKPEYTKRGKVDLALAVSDPNGEPVVGSFSIAVTDESKVTANEDEQTSILSNLLLTSDIKGHIEQPNYYFNSKNPDRQKHLDQLLLTQGWRRFSWADLQANKFPAITYRPEQGLSMSGNIVALNNKPVPYGKVTLYATTSGIPILLDTVADENGHFIFNDLNFPDSTKVVIKGANAKNSSDVKTIIEKRQRIAYVGFNDALNVANTGIDNYLKQTQQQFTELTRLGLMKNNTLLKEVTIKAVKDRDKFTTAKIIPHSSNLDPGSADWVVKQEILERETNFLDVFSRVPGVYIKDDLLYSVRADNSLIKYTLGNMLIILDGAQLPDDPLLLKQMMLDLNPKDLAAVEVLTGAGKGMYGNAGNKGVIIVTSKKGGEGLLSQEQYNMAHFVPQSYSPMKDFYSPAYDTPAATTRADLRSTIYWDPNVVTNAQGKASLSYFNADGTGIYKVTLEGMDTKGGLVRKTYTYLVK